MNAPIDLSTTILTTERLILRPWRPTDAADMFSYAKSPRVGIMAGWNSHKTIEESQKITQMFIDEKKTFAIEYQGRVVGSLGIEQYDEEHYPEFEDKKVRMLGFVLGEDYWGKGLMPEAVEEVLRFLFEEMELDLVLCGHFLSNPQSARVQEKCGFTPYDTFMLKTSRGAIEETLDRILTREKWLLVHEKSGIHPA